jgi:hypothetical protein
MDMTMKGGCACGAVRYALASAPYDCGWCHCTTCRAVSGAPAMAFATVPTGHFTFVTGEDQVGRFESSSFGWRQYCRRCGTPLTMQVLHQPETIDFAVATLDEPDGIEPAFHIFHASRIAWFDTADDLPRFARFRPDTRGLEGTEPPTD